MSNSSIMQRKQNGHSLLHSKLYNKDLYTGYSLRRYQFFKNLFNICDYFVALPEDEILNRLKYCKHDFYYSLGFYFYYY